MDICDQAVKIGIAGDNFTAKWGFKKYACAICGFVEGGGVGDEHVIEVKARLGFCTFGSEIDSFLENERV